MKKRLVTFLILALVMVLALTSCDFVQGIIDKLNPSKEEYVVYFITGEDSSHVTNQTVQKGALVTKPEDPVRKGYTFGGWFKDDALTTPWSFETDKVTKNTMIYGKWIENPHECESVCKECGKCLDTECKETVCADKCQGHVPPHECESVCDKCGKCTDTECTDDACKDKCAGHHTCESVCDKCSKCTDTECADDACKDKCAGHHTCESICDKCGLCTDAECEEAVCEEKCEGHELKDITVYLVGDSTVCSFDDDYFYPRYGWGTQLGGYLTDKATVVNLALSGRSSKSFVTESNYTTLKNSLKAGDYLLIAFGHNDEKSDDDTRFTDASLPYTDEVSFGWHLYEYYIKLAEEKGATPILVTPIVRAKSNNDYSGSEGHVTATGDYRQAIIDLGREVDVDVIDMTAITKARYEELGYDEAIKYHAVLQGKMDGTNIVENWNSVDKTHLNIYGAKYVAYNVASELQNLEGIKDYVAEGITAPTEADRVANPDYVVPDYVAPDLENYEAPDHFTTITEGWYGTAFGDTGGSPQSASNGYLARETSEGVFEVGQYKSGSNKGKFSSSSDGFAFLFRQVEADKNFKMTVTGTVTKTATTKQAGFGLMLRDDCIIDQDASGTIATNYLTAGIYADSSTKMMANFYRENGTFHKGETMNGMYAVDDTFTFTIERIGQTVHVTVVYNGTTYTESHYDFDLFARDGDYMYVGMFANRGTVVEFTDLQFEITGESQGAQFFT